MGREDGIMLNVQHSSLEASSLNVPSRREGTAQDKQDMWRVGRDQELNTKERKEMTRPTEELQVPFRTWVYSGAYVHMGSSSLGPIVRRPVSLGIGVRTPGSQALLSYLTGWICVCGWHTGIAGCSYTVANMMVGVIAINYTDTYTYERWHVTLLVIAVAIVALMFNTFLAQKLPLIEGPDSAVHMAEEIRDASRVLPMGMVWTLILNGSTGLVMIITFAFCVGDIDEVLKSETGFPFIQVFLNATGSVSATTGMTVVIMIMQFCAAISNVATTSRQIYSFARDKGLPFSDFLAQVNPTFTVPLNALCASLVIVSLLSLINIGSSVAFNAIMSLGTAALLSSYIISVTCVRLRRWRNQPLPPARWNMGKFTPICDTISIMVLLVIWIFSFFP
ncbi:hypothetical protein N7497_004415 [Penicillium chrysogenum]|nr:hypothetical protein N7497_004415 [Penicillium chrysogenum]